MAKQIYVDENGNPIEVSGTINTAELLPISGNDTTDTKSYIDGLIKYKDYSATLATQSGISPFTTFCGVNISDIYTNNDILGFYVKEPSWDNPTPCNINGYTIRVYGFKAEAIEVRVIYKKKQV